MLIDLLCLRFQTASVPFRYPTLAITQNLIYGINRAVYEAYC